MRFGGSLTRRSFFGVLAALSVWLLPGARRAGARASLSADWRERWARALPSRRSARIVGREYLRSRPYEADAALLVRLLEESLGAPRPQPDSGSAEILRRALRRSIEADYLAGRTLQLRGWVLARTEARLCALTRFL